MKVKCNSKYRKRRKQLRQARKKKNVTGVSYLSGGFGVGKVAETTAETPKHINKKTARTIGDKIKIHFVDERDVVLKIHQKTGQYKGQKHSK